MSPNFQRDINQRSEQRGEVALEYAEVIRKFKWIFRLD